MLAVTNKTNYKLHIKQLIFANKARTVKLPKVFKISFKFEYWDTAFNKTGKVIPV